MAVVRVVEYILTTFREASVILDIFQCLTPDATGIDEKAGLGEHAVQLFQRVDPFPNELPSQRGDLFPQVGHVQGGIGDKRVVGPSTVEVGGEFPVLQVPELSSH